MFVARHGRVLARAGAPAVLHGFGVWGAAAVSAARTAGGLGHTLRLAGELAWVRGVVNASERRGFEGAARLLCNYESVRTLLLARYAVADRLRVVPYTAECAYLPLRPLEQLERPAALDALRPTDALRRLLGDAALRARLAQQGRARFEQRFGPELLSACLRETYSEFGAAPDGARER